MSDAIEHIRAIAYDRKVLLSPREERLLSACLVALAKLPDFDAYPVEPILIGIGEAFGNDFLLRFQYQRAALVFADSELEEDED